MFTICFLGIGMGAYSQDVIVKKDGEEIKSKVMEVSGDEIKYKMWDYQRWSRYIEFRLPRFL